MNRLAFFIIVLLRAVAVAMAHEVTADNDPWVAFDKAREALHFQDGLTLMISTPKTDYFAGEPVAVTFKYELNGPGGVTVWTGKFVRSVRIQDIHWIVTGPGGKAAPDPLAGLPQGNFGGVGHQDVARKDSPVVETFPLNEWVRFDTPGEYQIAAISHRIRDGGNGVASNRIKLNIRKPTAAEIDAAIAEYVKAIDDPNPEDNENPGRNLGYLRALYSERALPQYLKYLGKSDAALGLYGIPDKQRSLNALTAKLQEPDFAITRDAESIYEDLYRAVHPPEKGDTTIDWTGIPEAQRKAIDEDLHRWALAKSPKARANSLYGLDAGRNWPLEMAAALKDLDGYERETAAWPYELQGAIQVLGLHKDMAIVPYLEPLLENPSPPIRTAALDSLVKMDIPRYIDLAFENWISPKPKIPNVYLGNRPATEAQQLKLARMLNDDDYDTAKRAAQCLSDVATAKAAAPYIKKALEDKKHPQHYGPTPFLLEAWVKVAPAEAKQALLEYLRGAKADSDLFKLLDHSLDDPAVPAILVGAAGQADNFSAALGVLVDARRTEAVPILLARMRKANNLFAAQTELNALEKVTDHIMALTADMTALEKQTALLDRWEQEWDAIKGKPPIERHRANIAHGIELVSLPDEEEGVGVRAYSLLSALTGHEFDQALYLDNIERDEDGAIANGIVNKKKLQALWRDWWKENRESWKPPAK